METRADQYRRKADRAREFAKQARDPFIKISYQELGRDWAALAEQAEWLESHQQPANRLPWTKQQNSGSGRSTGRNAPPPRLTPKRASAGEKWLTPGTLPPRWQQERLR